MLLMQCFWCLFLQEKLLLCFMLSSLINPSYSKFCWSKFQHLIVFAGLLAFLTVSCILFQNCNWVTAAIHLFVMFRPSYLVLTICFHREHSSVESFSFLNLKYWHLLLIVVFSHLNYFLDGCMNCFSMNLNNQHVESTRS